MPTVSFVDFEPAPRFDGISWTQVTIGEAAGEAGPFTHIDTIQVGVDADPAHPAARSFTTRNATLLSGWYEITFLDATGADQSPVAPVPAEAVGESSFLPTIKDVALKIMSRTRDSYGNELGTFTKVTRPSDDQVLAIIRQIAPVVGDAIGDDIPSFLWDDAQNVIATRAAMQIELDFYSDQVNTGRSIYPQLEQQFKDDLALLQQQVVLAEEGDTQPGSTSAGRSPSFSFPAPSPTDWLTRPM